MPYHKSIGSRSSSRWRAARATSSRRRRSGRCRRVAAASRRSGRNARRAGPGVARFVNLANLARQLHRSPIVFFSTCRVRECGWLVTSATSSEDGDKRDLVSSVVFFPLWTGNHCGSRSMVVEALEHSRALGGALCKPRKTVVRTFLHVLCCSLRLA